MVWKMPKTNWDPDDGVMDEDMNRIEGNEEYLKNNLDTHKADQTNPHKVTIAQAGAEGGDLDDISDGSTFGKLLLSALSGGNPKTDSLVDGTYQKVHGDYVGASGEIVQIKQGTTYNIPETRYYTVSLVVQPPSAPSYGIGTKWVFTNSAPNSYLPINLPHGAVVTQLDVWASSYTGYIALKRSPLSTSGEGTMAQVDNGTGTDNSIVAPIIDNNNYSYYIHGYASGGTCECYGIRITYTINKPLP